ncbi:MAG: 16S rRNA (uracil(1498)-N(3))-methyltransferase [Clostridiales bacterium]|nr:16S rRNA (uracil(1498)-N(3))-methyltransferase [Clostridiales bacterium]
MQKLFVETIDSKTILLGEEQSRHIVKSLRMKKGDLITLTDGGGYEYVCMLESTKPGNTFLTVCYKKESDCEPGVKVSLYQSMPKGGKMEDIIQKSVEMGAFEIVPVITKRSIKRPDEKQAEKANARYNKIALEAAQQSGRGIVPRVGKTLAFDEALRSCKAEQIIVFYEGGGEPIKNIISACPSARHIAVFIGPEGGFDKSEIDSIVSRGGKTAGLGKRILRCETAPIAALTAIMLLTGNLE